MSPQLRRPDPRSDGLPGLHARLRGASGGDQLEAAGSGRSAHPARDFAVPPRLQEAPRSSRGGWGLRVKLVRNDKIVTTAAIKFMAHLVNQKAESAAL